MSTQKYPVRVAVKDDKGKVVRECTLNVSNSHPSDSHTFNDLSAGEYNVEYTPPDGFELTSSPSSHHTFTSDRNGLKVGVKLVGSAPTELSASQDSSLSEPALSPIGKILGLTVVSLVIFGTLRLPIDFFPKTSQPNTSEAQQIRSLSRPIRTNASGQPETRMEFTTASIEGQSKAASLSALGNKLRTCLVTNIRDVSGVPTLSDLAKNVTLVEVTDEQIRKEATELYDKVGRLRQILQGCDPKLAHEIIAAKIHGTSPNQLDPNVGASEGVVQSVSSVTISTCNGTPSDAYFRSAPTLAEWAILGVVERGQQGYLTGRTYEADGVVWYETIVPGAVANSGTQITQNQVGWIADCFVQ